MTRCRVWDDSSVPRARTASVGAISNVWPRADTHAMFEIVGHATNATRVPTPLVLATVAECDPGGVGSRRADQRRPNAL